MKNKGKSSPNEAKNSFAMSKNVLKKGLLGNSTQGSSYFFRMARIGAFPSAGTVGVMIRKRKR